MSAIETAVLQELLRASTNNNADLKKRITALEAALKEALDEWQDWLTWAEGRGEIEAAMAEEDLTDISRLRAVLEATP